MHENNLRARQETKHTDRITGLVVGAIGINLYLLGFRLPEPFTKMFAGIFLPDSPLVYGVLTGMTRWISASIGALITTVGLMMIGPDDEDGGLKFGYLLTCLFFFCATFLLFAFGKDALFMHYNTA